MTAPAWDTKCSVIGCHNERMQGARRCNECERVFQSMPPTAQFASKARMPELFDPPAPPVAPAALATTKRPRARRTDRSTSQRAADGTARGLTTKQRAVLTVFVEYGPALHDEALVAFYRELRSHQLARGFGAQLPDLTDSSIRTRRNELVQLGRVRDTGRETTTARGGSTAVWEVVTTAAGHEPVSAEPRAETPPPAAE